MAIIEVKVNDYYARYPLEEEFVEIAKDFLETTCKQALKES